MKYHLTTRYEQEFRLLREPREAIPWLVLVAVLGASPWLFGAYWTSQLTLILIYATAGLGLMLLAGFTGLVSIGHGAFLGVGAYTEAVLTAAGWPIPLALLAAAFLSAAAGVVIAVPALRVRGIYLAVSTLAFGFIVEEVFTRWTSVTGGAEGLSLRKVPFAELGLSAIASVHLLALIVCILVTVGVLNLLRSATGRALIAIRDSEISAQSMGIQVAFYKTISFTVSAAIVGLAGAMYAHKLRFISPEQFGISQSIELLLLIVVGGMGSVHGAFLGAVVIVALPQLISLGKDYLPPNIGQGPGLQVFVFGALLVGFVVFEPTGLYGRWVKIRTYLSLFPAYRQGMFRRQKAFLKAGGD
jgi:branched-chain amino acid transport system permease protein